MDSLIIWKSLIIFVFTFNFFWIIFYTFQPEIFEPNDKIAPNSGARGCTGSNCLLSDSGRTILFLYSLIPAGVVTFLYIFYSLFFSKPVIIKCSPKAKKLGQCKIERK